MFFGTTVCWKASVMEILTFYYWLHVEFVLTFIKGQLISEWIYEVIVSPKIRTKNCQDFCPSTQGRNPDNFSFVFWEKRWLHKFVLKLSDLYLEPEGQGRGIIMEVTRPLLLAASVSYTKDSYSLGYTYTYLKNPKRLISGVKQY